MPRPTLDFDRNDLDAAMRAWDSNAALAKPDPDVTESLVKMFDDPSALFAAIDARLAARRPRRSARA